MTREEKIADIQRGIGDTDNDVWLADQVPFLLSEVKRLEAENAELQKCAIDFEDIANDKTVDCAALQKETEALRARNVELESKLKASDDARYVLERDTAELRRIKGVACLEGHDLCHSIACGRCFSALRSKLDVATQQNKELKISLMTTVEWVQSNYPGVIFDKDLLRANREALAEIKGEK